MNCIYGHGKYLYCVLIKGKNFMSIEFSTINKLQTVSSQSKKHAKHIELHIYRKHLTMIIPFLKKISKRRNIVVYMCEGSGENVSSKKIFTINNGKINKKLPLLRIVTEALRCYGNVCYNKFQICIKKQGVF